MKRKTYIRLSLVILVFGIGMMLYAFSRRSTLVNAGNSDCSGKCDQQKTQTEFVLWESISRNLFSTGR